MTVEYATRRPPAAAELVDRLEQRLGCALPDEYREYLREQDGGELESNSQAMNTVFGLGDVPDWASLWDVLETYQDRVPAWLLPVASDAFGNLFAVSLRPADRGTVWWWDHELEADEDEPPTEDNVKQVAPDWAAFLAALAPVRR